MVGCFKLNFHDCSMGNLGPNGIARPSEILMATWLEHSRSHLVLNQLLSSSSSFVECLIQPSALISQYFFDK